MIEQEQLIASFKERETALGTEISALNLLYRLSAQLLRPPDLRSTIELILDAAMEILGAPMGNVQLYDPAQKALKIVAQRGFTQEFLDYFREVSLTDSSACGRALAARERLIIEDVDQDRDYAPHRAIAASAGYRAVQSTPLLSREGELLGVVSTHFPQPHRPTEHECRMLDLYLVHATDTIDRVRTRELARRQAQMLEETHDAIFQWQFDGGIIHWNRGAERLYGYTAEEAQGKRPSQLLQTEREDGVTGIKEILQRVGFWTGELRHRRKDGREILVESRMVLWRNADSAPIVIAANRDITDRKATEQALRESEQKLRDQARELEQQLIASGRLISLGEVTASMAHEFNNPLGVIIGFAEELLSSAKPNDPEYRSLEIINQEAYRCKKIVEDLLSYARPRAAEVSWVNLEHVIDRTLDLVQIHLYKQKVKALKEVPNELPRIQADPQQLTQVLVNLYLNALDAMRSGGELTVKAILAESDGKREVVISVADTGHGIDPSDMEKMFQPFYTAKKRRGLGLGLPICERIVKNHGGQITAQSRPGLGSVFEIRLPAAPGEG